MPLFEVELHDGRKYRIEADTEPSEAEVMQAIGGQFQNLKPTGPMMGARPATFGERFVDPVLQKVQPMFARSPRQLVSEMSRIPGRVIRSAFPAPLPESLLPNLFKADPGMGERGPETRYERLMDSGDMTVLPGPNLNPALLPSIQSPDLGRPFVPATPRPLNPYVTGALKTVGAPLAGINQLLAGATSPEAPLFLNPYTRALMVGGMIAESPEAVQQAIQEVKGPSDIPKAAVDIAGATGLPIALGATLAERAPRPTGIRSEVTPQDMAAIRAMPSEPYRGFEEVPVGQRLAQFSESTLATQQRRAAAEEQLRRAAEGGRADVQGMPFLTEPRARGEVTATIGATGVPAERPAVPFPAMGPEKQIPEVVASTLRQREAIEQARRAAEGGEGTVPGMPFVSKEAGQGPVSGAIQTRMQSGIDPEGLRKVVSALRLSNGRIIRGINQEEGHQSLWDRLSQMAARDPELRKSLQTGDVGEGFADSDRFYTRDQAMTRFGFQTSEGIAGHDALFSGVRIDPDTLRTAIRIGGRLLVGLRGESHAETLKRYGYNPDDYPHTDPSRGFISTGKPEEFLDRRQAEQLSGLKGTAEAGGLDSGDLPGINTAAALRRAGYSEDVIERETQDAIRELRTSNVPKEAPPGDLQKMGEEVRPGAEAQGVAREAQVQGETGLQRGTGAPSGKEVARQKEPWESEPQQSLARIEPKAEGTKEKVAPLAPLSTSSTMNRSLKNLINIFLGRAGVESSEKLIGTRRSEEARRATHAQSGGIPLLGKARTEDLYPDELKQIHDYLKQRYEEMQKFPGQSEEISSAKDLSRSLWEEIRNKLFDAGLKKGENVVGASLEDLRREQERIENALREVYKKGPKEVPPGVESRLTRSLQTINELIKKQEGSEGTRLYSGMPLLDDLKQRLRERETFKKIVPQYRQDRPGEKGSYIRFRSSGKESIYADRGDLETALHETVHSFTSNNKSEITKLAEKNLSWQDKKDLAKLVNNLGSSYAPHAHALLQSLTTGKPNAGLWRSIDELTASASGRSFWNNGDWTVNTAYSIINKVYGSEFADFLREGHITKEEFYPKWTREQGGSFYSGISLPETWEKVKDVLTRPVIGPVLDKLYGNEVRREPSEAIRHVKSKWSGEAVPHHVAASEEVANRLVEFASADVTAGQYAKALASEALGSHYRDKQFSERLGRVIIQDRLDALRQYHQKRGETGLASRVATEMPENEFRQALRDPEIKAALERHKNTVQKVAEQQHTALGGKLAATGPETGTFANLQNILHAENRAAAEAIIYSGNVMTKAIQKGSVFGKHATGTAPGYVTDYRTVAQRMVEGNYKRNALRNWLNEGVKAGLYSYGDVGQTPAVRGMKAVSMPVRVKATPWGSQTVKNLWVRADLAPEVSQALSGSGRVPKAGMQMLLDAATELQVIGPTDFTFHTANMFSSVVKSQGKYPNYAIDLVARMPVIKQIDAVGRLGWNLYKVLADDPQVQAELARISRIGALRPQATEYSSTLLARGTGGLLDTAKWIKIFDRAGRLARDKMFDNGVKMKLWDDTELNRREFINRMGQYNAKLMSRFQDIMRSYVSQFVVAGRTFNRNAVESALLLNEVRAASPVAYWKMKMSNALALAATVAALPMVLNSVMTGKPYGRAGTPAGAIDTGKDDDQGRPIIIDLAKTDLTRRGFRITGLGTALEGIRQGDSAEKILGKMSSDIIQGQLHPWEGPPIRVVEGYTKELYKSHDPKEAAKAGLMAVNPTITAAFSEDERGKRGGLSGVGRQLSTSVGYGPGSYPRHEDKLEEQAGRKVEDMSLGERAVEEGVMRIGQQKRSPESQAQAAAKKIQSNTKRGTEVMGTLSKADRNWLKSRGLFLPGFDNRVRVGGENVYLTDKEMTRYTELIKLGYEEAIKTLRENYDSIEDLDKRQKLYSDVFSEARKAAREQLMQELVSESEKDRRGRKFKALQ